MMYRKQYTRAEINERVYLEGNPLIYNVEQSQWVHPVRLARLTVRGILVSMVV